jgi:hypothetical protein
MSPEQFTPFDDAWPAKNKHVIVTNNLSAKNAHGEMSHVWMTRFLVKDNEYGVMTFDASDCRIRYLTHWKYA